MLQNIPLAELKNKVEAHLKNKLDLILLLAKLDEDNAKEFGDWFQQHPY